MGQTNLNGRWFDQPTPQMATLYASPYLVATPKGYTKHYYAGTERVASKLGGGGLRDINQPVSFESPPSAGPAPLYPVNVVIQTKWEQYQEPYRQIWKKCVNSLMPEMSPEVELSNLYDYESIQTAETAHYYYHPDHLGSASWITDSSGKAIQHLQYLPFGETRVDQRKTSWSTRYSFSAKEKDEESGYGYFGARYYDSDISIWLSVDPMASKYPSTSAYAYCNNNPIILVDPDGRTIVITHAGQALNYTPGMKVPEGSSKFVSDAITGLNYLHANPEGSYNRVQNIVSSEITVNVMQQEAGLPSVYSGRDLSLMWDNTTADVYDGGSQSPIIGLAHELDHGDRSVKGWEDMYSFEVKGDTKSDAYNNSVKVAYGDRYSNSERQSEEQKAMNYENFIGGKEVNGKKLSTYKRMEYVAPQKQVEVNSIFSTGE
jgi:RHS repeat-associated protein